VQLWYNPRMDTPAAAHRPYASQKARLIQAALAVAAGVGLALFAALFLLFAFERQYRGRVYPGVHVAGVDVSGMTPAQAAEALNKQLTYAVDGRIAFTDGERRWTFAPAQLGLFLNPEGSVQAAFEIGRTGGIWSRLREQFRAWRVNVYLPPQLLYDERAAYQVLQSIASEIDRPTVEASLEVQGLDVVVQPGQIGRRVDIPATLDALRPAFQAMQDATVPLVIRETPPAILDVSAEADRARRILSAPLTITLPDAAEGDPGPWVISREDLASMLVIRRVTEADGSARYQVGLDEESLRAILQPLAAQLERAPENARFIFNDDTRELELIRPAVIGRSLSLEATIRQIQEALAEGQHEVPLVMAYTPPQVADDATAADLGITELVSVQTSYFYGSSAGRIQNIQTAAAQFHGLLIPPGGQLSMAEVLGDISLDNGYAEALIIYGDRTIQGVGGGVCQVSTTLFRTVFFGGYQIDERHPHAYRVYYYELTASGGVNSKLAGLDATVFVPLVDFKFTNDSPYWLLMETYVNVAARSLTWKFYSTSDGRTVSWDTTGLQNKVDPPEPLYKENPDLKKGEIRQVDWAVEGADVTVRRWVYRDGELIHQDVFSTHYLPWRAVCEYGPGTKGMPPKHPDPKRPCTPDT